MRGEAKPINAGIDLQDGNFMNIWKKEESII
jgi:hypothetical protein